MSGESGGQTAAVRLCVNNLYNHNWLTVLPELKRRGIDFAVETCLNNCGSCRHGAFYECYGRRTDLTGSGEPADQIGNALACYNESKRS